jgi:hypothetical protein
MDGVGSGGIVGWPSRRYLFIRPVFLVLGFGSLLVVVYLVSCAARALTRHLARAGVGGKIPVSIPQFFSKNSK